MTNKSLYSLIDSVVEQTSVTVNVTGVIDQFIKLYGISSSEVYSLMFWDNAIITSALSDDNVNAYCPTKKRIDSFKTFINYTLLNKLNPPKLNPPKLNYNKNLIKSISHKIRYCKLIFLLSQNPDNRYELLSQSANS